MKEKIFAFILSIMVVVTMTPAISFAGQVDYEQNPGDAVAKLTHEGAADAYYDSLKDAVEAAASGDVVTLLADDRSLAQGAEIVIAKSLTITGETDASGAPKHTIYGQSTNNGQNDIFIRETGDVTISNLKFREFGSEANTGNGHAPIYVSGSFSGTVNFVNLDISQFNRAGIIISGGSFVVDGCRIDCSKSAGHGNVLTKGVEVLAGNATGTIKNTTVTGATSTYDEWTTGGVEYYGSGDISVKDCTISGLTNGVACGYEAGGTVTVSGCNIDVTGNALSITKGGNKTPTMTMNVESGNYKGANSIKGNAGTINVSAGSFTGDVVKGEDGTVAISGGTFSTDASAYCVEGYTMEQQDGVYVVKANVAEVDGVGYTSFEAAVEAAGGTKTIKLLQKITEPYTMTSTDQVLKVEKNGKTITVKAPAGPYVVSNSTSEGVTTYTVADATFEITKANGTVSYSNSFSMLNGNGSTVKLLKDFTSTSCPNCGSTVYKNCNVTLDLNGHTLSVNSANRDYCILVTQNNTLTIKNGTINMAPTSDSKSNGIRVEKNSTLNIEEDVVVNAEGVSAVTVLGAVTVNSEGKLSATNSFTIAGNGSNGNGGYTVNITGGEVSATGASAIYHPNTGTVNITGGTITGATAIYQKSGELNVSGGTLNATGNKVDYAFNGNGANATGDALVIDNCGYPGGMPAVNITGGTFNSANAEAAGSYAYGEGNSPVDKFITGGTFSTDVSAYCAEGYKTVKQADGKYMVVERDYAAQIGNAKYESLAEAFAAAETGDTVKLLRDVAVEGLTVDKNVTLDMNGKTVSSDEPFLFTVESNGDLTIKGNGKITGPANGEAFDGNSLIMVKGGKLTVEDGTLTATGEGSDGMYGVYVLNGGTAIFGKEDGTGPSITSHFAAVGTNNTTAPATITIKGGSYTAEATPANNEWWSYFCAPIYAASSGTYNITGGTFTGYYGISSRYANVDQNLTIDGGEFAASSGIAVFVDNVTGSAGEANRQISSNVSTLTVPEGYAWVEDAGKYKLSKTYTVTFDSAGGSEVDAQIVAEGAKATEPSATKEGKVLHGWYKGEAKYDFSTPVTEDITLKAVWIDSEEALANQIAAIQEQIDGLNAAIAALDDTYATDAEVADAVAAAKAAIESAQAQVDAAQDQALTATAAELTTAIASAKEALEAADTATLTAAKAYTDAAAEGLQNQITALSNTVDALDETYATDADVAAKIAAAKEAIETAQAAVDAAQDEALASKAAELTTAIASAKEALEAADTATLAAAKEYTDAAAEGLQNQITALSNTVDALDETYATDADVAAKIAAAKEAIETAQAAVDAAQDDALASKAAELTAAIASAKEALEAADAATLTAAKAYTDAAIADLSEDVEGNATAIAENAAKIAALETAVGSLQGKDQELEAAIGQAKTELQHAITTAMNDLQTKIDASNERIAALETAGEGTADEIASIKENITTIQNALTLLEEKAAALENADQSLASNIAALANRVDALSEALDAQEESLKVYMDALAEDLQDQIDDLSEVLESLDDTYATDTDVAAKIAAAKEAIETAQEAVDAAQDEALANKAGELTQAINEAKAALEEADAATLEAAKAYTDEVAAGLQSQIDELSDKIDSLDAEYATNEEVASKIDEAKAAIESAQAAVDAAQNGDMAALKDALNEAISATDAADRATLEAAKAYTDTAKSEIEQTIATEIAKLREEFAQFTVESVDVNLVASSGGYQSVNLKWNTSKIAVDGENITYTIYYKPAKGTWSELYSEKCDGNGTSMTYKVKRLKTGTKYYFYAIPSITAGGKTFTGAKSVVKNATPKLAKVTLVKVSTGTKAGTIKYTFKKVKGAQGYQVYYRDWRNIKGKYKVVTGSKAKITKTITKLTKGHKYSVKVRAFRLVDGKKVYGKWSVKKSAEVK